MTRYAKYYKKNYPVGNSFNDKDQKLIESAQCGIGDETTLRLAIANADAGDLIVLAPTTITLTSQLVVDKPLVFRGTSSGVGGTKITCASTFATSLISIELTATSTASEVKFSNIHFAHGADDLDVIDANNTNMSAALNLCFENCQITVFDASANGWGVDVGHATAGQAVSLQITGNGMGFCDAVNFAVKNAGDTIDLRGMKMRDQGKATCVVTSADALAAQIRCQACQFPHELATSGGNAAQLLITTGCTSLTGTTYALLDTNDLIGSQTETIL